MVPKKYPGSYYSDAALVFFNRSNNGLHSASTPATANVLTAMDLPAIANVLTTIALPATANVLTTIALPATAIVLPAPRGSADAGGRGGGCGRHTGKRVTSVGGGDVRRRPARDLRVGAADPTRTGGAGHGIRGHRVTRPRRSGLDR